MRPIKTRAGVLFAARCNVFVAPDVRNRIVVGQCGAQGAEGFVLAGFKSLAIQSLQFNANGEIVAIVLAIEVGNPSVPCPVIATHQLPQLAFSADEKMGRNLQTFQALKVRVFVDRQLVGEQIQHMRGAIFPRWQADGMHHHQVDGRAHGPGAKVGRGAAARVPVPAMGPQGLCRLFKHASCAVAQLVLFAAKKDTVDGDGIGLRQVKSTTFAVHHALG